MTDCGYRKDRDSRGGGVMVAVKNSIPCEQLPSPPELELVTISKVLERLIYN